MHGVGAPDQGRLAVLMAESARQQARGRGDSSQRT